MTVIWIVTLDIDLYLPDAAHSNSVYSPKYLVLRQR
jgi:hypothetical protein